VLHGIDRPAGSTRVEEPVDVGSGAPVGPSRRTVGHGAGVVSEEDATGARIERGVIVREKVAHGLGLEVFQISNVESVVGVESRPQYDVGRVGWLVLGAGDW